VSTNRRALFGPRHTALLVIDVQQSFEHAPYWSPVDTAAFYDRLQALIDGAHARQIPIVQIFHVEESGHFSLDSGFVKAPGALCIEPQAVFHKPRHSALIGSGLPHWLIEHGIQRLMISGIRTEQCCETTTRHAADSGYHVDFVSEATLTFAMTDRGGRHWNAADIKARTELVLEERFARILSVERALDGAKEAHALEPHAA
jgi:nicotinamidase-related amidase